jgi:hypothetical protein
MNALPILIPVVALFMLNRAAARAIKQWADFVQPKQHACGEPGFYVDPDGVARRPAPPAGP